MRIDMMLADQAMVHQNKLFVLGAAINILAAATTPNHYFVTFAIPMTIVAESQDVGEHCLRISITDRAGEPIRVDQRKEAEQPDALWMRFTVTFPDSLDPKEQLVTPIVFNFNSLEVPRIGVYTVEARMDDALLSSLSFRVTAPAGLLALADP